MLHDGHDNWRFTGTAHHYIPDNNHWNREFLRFIESNFVKSTSQGCQKPKNKRDGPQKPSQ